MAIKMKRIEMTIERWSILRWNVDAIKIQTQIHHMTKATIYSR